MKKLMLIFIVFSFLSCDNGNIDKPSFDFTNIVTTCGEYVLYRLGNNNSNEALILTLNSSDIPDTAIVTNDLALNNNRTITYRLFDNSVTTNYFCAAVPPTTPMVIKNWKATAGTIDIITTEVLDTDSNPTDELNHEITFINLVLTSGDETITFDRYEFGNFKTTPTVEN